MVRNFRFLVILAVCAAAAGCAPRPVKISPTAVGEVASIAERPSLRALTLESDDITRLADRAGVEDDVIRDVAPNLDSESVWSGSLQGLREVYEQTPEQVRGDLVGIACEYFTGDITSVDELATTIIDRFQGASDGELIGYADAVVGLWQELREAGNSSDPDTKAAAIITCFTVEHAVS